MDLPSNNLYYLVLNTLLKNYIVNSNILISISKLLIRVKILFSNQNHHIFLYYA